MLERTILLRFTWAWVSLVLACDIGVAGPFTQLVIFGDSLSDVGNVAQASFDLFPGSTYYNDRFSNGPVYAESLAVGLGLPPVVRSTAGGNNFAYGGARTSGTGGLEGFFIRDIDEQVTQFLNTRTVDPGALFIVFAGSNNLIAGQTDVSTPVNRLATDIGRLVAAGATNFLVPNLPPIGNTPSYNDNPTTQATYNSRSLQFNAALAAMLDGLEAANPSLSLFRFDVAALFNEALANPGEFGLTNVTDAAAPGLEPGMLSYDASQVVTNAHEYLFWDELHPTATVHAILAERLLELFVLPGDFNDDGMVDAADYVYWRRNDGKAVDYAAWQSNFGATREFPLADASYAQVPESNSVILLLMTVIIGTATRHGRIAR